MSKTKANQKRRMALSRAPRFRILPLTMIMLVLLLVQRVNDVYFGSVQLSGMLSVSSAVAEEAKPEEVKSEAEKGKEQASENAKEGEEKATTSEPEPEVTLGRGKKTIDEVMAIKERQNQEKMSPVEMDLLKSLSARREELDARERDIALKAKVLEATEDRIDKRIGEIKLLTEELQGVLKQYQNQQDAEIRGLVKIYENMKPVDAATIFNQLDMDILLSVVDKMSERKVAPVLAAMDPRRAKEVTEQLAELRQLRSHAAKKAIDLTEQPAR